MRIILSRKGLDSKAGGIPSPIIENKLIPMPIPSSGQISYDNLKFGSIPIGKLVNDLSKGKLKPNAKVHLDPDLRKNSYQREAGWRPIFGQGQRAAESHLINCGVTIDDLFLFYGWFRDAELRDGVYRYIKGGRSLHIIYGWLQIGSIVSCDDPQLSPFHWAKYHPHFQNMEGTAFISRKNICYKKKIFDVAGGGCFSHYDDNLCLTDVDSNHRRDWRFPKWFYPRNGCFPITYHPNKRLYQKRNNYTFLTSAARGQEFVIDTWAYKEAEKWAFGKILR